MHDLGCAVGQPGLKDILNHGCTLVHTDGSRRIRAFGPCVRPPVTDTLRVPAGMPAGCASLGPALQASSTAGPSSPTCGRLVGVAVAPPVSESAPVGWSHSKRSARGQDRGLVQAGLDPRFLAQHTFTRLGRVGHTAGVWLTAIRPKARPPMVDLSASVSICGSKKCLPRLHRSAESAARSVFPYGANLG